MFEKMQRNCVPNFVVLCDILAATFTVSRTGCDITVKFSDFDCLKMTVYTTNLVWAPNTYLIYVYAIVRNAIGWDIKEGET